MRVGEVSKYSLPIHGTVLRHRFFDSREVTDSSDKPARWHAELLLQNP